MEQPKKPHRRGRKPSETPPKYPKTNPNGKKKGEKTGTAGAQPASAHAEKYNTPELRREMWKNLNNHLQTGLGKHCFPDCAWDTCMHYMRKYPEDCPAEELDRSMRLQQRLWESMGVAGASGAKKNINPSLWIFNMKNRFGWKDRVEHSGTGVGGAIATQEVEPLSVEEASQQYQALMNEINGNI